MRYYSTQRPVSVGTYPKAGVQEIHNFDRKTFCEDISREAWGYIDYDRELTGSEADSYELTPAGLKKFYCVTTSFDDRGRVASAITREIEAIVQPENTSSSTSRKDIYNDWFDSREAALEWVQEAKRA
ncbi:MAG: hypothetical protein HFJ86_12465 [Oscillospiraceae bacterium]|jgi:hypothetical protein|nr:hypothetical protein [Oscillospiraceae bacterium]